MAEALYRQVAADLRAKINTGELPPGIQLPSESALERLYGHLSGSRGDAKLSRNTVRLAIAILQNEGLVEARHGRGTFVRERVTFTVLASAEEGVEVTDRDAFVAAVSVQGRKPEQLGLRMEIRTASPEVAERLRIEEGDTVVVRSMNRLIDGRPWSIQESFYPMDIAAGTLLMSPQNIEHGTVTELRRHGHGQVGYRDEIVCRMPTQAEAVFLGLGAGVPVLELFRTAHSPDRPIRLTINVYAGDSTQLAYNIGEPGNE
ncbi:GntR family transcriptional regulator [Acrocarpospora macrocephala]|uniref:GntR family transcriptional regulator n=1 Tax=Acrocarpospora macrocephala TaxID=150177 RepID=A0A5M3WL21_9ACTN|nr:GntR family transcriptional regulator [Acrocarpospora macrocephala]GES09180.1 GntR family transcriptional regulator [Acrocarpospora macrocephala]